MRYIYFLRKYDHVSSYCNLVIECNLFDYFDFRVCFLIRNLIKFKQPIYLYEKLQMAFNFRKNYRFIVPYNNCKAYSNSAMIEGIILWNSIPLEIKQARTKNDFFNKFIKWRISQVYTK